MRRRAADALRRALIVAALSLPVACARPAPIVPGPDSAPPPVRELLAAGDAQAGRAEPEQAIQSFQAAVAAEPDAVPAHLRYIAAMLELGRYSEVRAQYQERAARPDARPVDRVMAQRLETNGSSSALRRVYTLAATAEPQNPWWPLALAEVEIAEADAWNAKRIEAATRGDHAEERRGFAQAKGAADRANRALERAGRLAPRLGEAALYRGYLRAVEGDLQAGGAARRAAYDAAESAFEQATALDADLVEAWAGLGDVRFRRGDLGGSLDAWLAAARLAPADAAYRESLGVVLHELERYDDAARQYREAARLRSWDAAPLIRLGDALADAERWNRALGAYAEALARDPEAIEAHYKSGTVLEYLGRLGEARAAYERYVEAGGERASSVRRRIERLLRRSGR
ncbi:MAG: tetratricopeptide repeat protein [Planctomycetota bacterium]|nr:tetratricopeptide repeat protein [Planctomycetota bacterium]